MSDLSKHKNHFLLLVEAGFIAVNQSDEDSAVKLFEAAHLINKESPLPGLGMGYLHMCKLELKKAAEDFHKVLHKDPHNEMAKAMLGLTLSMTPDHWKEGEKVLHETAKSQNKEVKNLSHTTLEFVDKYVKKPVSHNMDHHNQKDHKHK